MRAADIASQLAERIEALCQELLPQGRRVRDEWVEARCRDGGLGDSLQVHLAGPKRGIWAHIATGRGGDALDFVAYIATDDDKGEAIKWALRWLGLDDGEARAPTRRSAPTCQPNQDRDRDERARQAAALRLWHEARPGAGEPVERYLRHRGITVPVPPTLRYHPAARYDRSGLLVPCMVAAVQAPDRRVVAVHRTYIRDDGGGKAGVATPKKALGLIGAGAVRLAAAGSVLGLAEGVETALSAYQLYDVPVWAALGARMDRVELPAEVSEVHLFADNGEPGHEAAEKAAARFMAGGLRVVLRFPPAGVGDFNDLLRDGSEGVAA